MIEILRFGVVDVFFVVWGVEDIWKSCEDCAVVFDGV